MAAVAALLAARALGMPEYYWAPVSAVIVVQSDLGSSLKMSWHRLVGTALGAALAAVAVESLGRSVAVYGCGVLGAGLVSVLLRLERPANRFAAIAFTIVFLLQRNEPTWVVALHRFIEVSTGIMAGLLLSALWPEPRATISQAHGPPRPTDPPRNNHHHEHEKRRHRPRRYPGRRRRGQDLRPGRRFPQRGHRLPPHARGHPLDSRAPRRNGSLRRGGGCPSHREARRLRGQLRPGQFAPHQRPLRLPPQPRAGRCHRGADPESRAGQRLFQETHPEHLFAQCSH